MKKRLILGDVHGRTEAIQRIYDKELPDEVVCMGDLYDPYDADSAKDIYNKIDNFLALWKKHNSEHRENSFVLLMGNHDFQYLPYVEEETNRYTRQTRKQTSEMFNSLIGSNQIKVAFIDDINKTIYTHAGVSNTWFYTVYNGTDIHSLSNPLTEEIARDFELNYIKGIDLTGDTTSQSCIWIRPNSLSTDMFKDADGVVWKQVVGHTRISTPFIDGNNGFLKLNAPLTLVDTSQNYYLIQYIDDNGVITETKAFRTPND